jgi:UPF0755 protein
MLQKFHRVYPTSFVRQTGGVFSTLLLLAVVLSLAVAAGAAWWVQQPLAMQSPSIELSIETGTTPKEVAKAWVDAGVQTSPQWLYWWFRVSGKSRQIKAGSYELQRGASAKDLLGMMVQGDERLSVVKLIEGWTFKRFRQELAQADGLKPASANMSDEQIMASLDMPGIPAEGQFFPDTYAYTKGSTDLAVMRRALHAMQRHLTSAWAFKADASPLKQPQDLLILASIVEKETGRESDRPMIAGVFVNRLRIGMPLQTDPSVIYGLGDAFDGNLRKVHLQTDTPFNTYTRKGLPPTPIAMPGKAALMAAAQPAQTHALYFVAKGDGSSAFSATLNEHNRAVNQYQRNARKSP